MESRLSFQTKIVLSTTIILLIGSILIIGVMEYNNVTIQGLSPVDKINNIIFMAVTPRTAGFSNVNLVDMRLATTLVTIILMFIGGSSGSTAGGIKTTTIAIVMLAVYSSLRQRGSVRVFARRISTQSIDAAFTVTTTAFLAVLLGTFIMTISEPAFGLVEILFETVSAFGTVGSTLGMTPALSVVGKCIIMLLMYIGRVGPVTFGISLLVEKTSPIRYPEGKVLIG